MESRLLKPAVTFIEVSGCLQLDKYLSSRHVNAMSFCRSGHGCHDPILTLVHILVNNEIIMEYNVHEAKTHFSRLLQKVAAGEEVTIARDGVPVARLVPMEAAKTPRKLGMYSGKIWMADDFDAPLPPDILAGFHGEEPPVKKTKKKKK